MKLREFTCTTSDDGERIVSVAGRISDHADPAQRQEWLAFRLSVDVPTVRNGALLREEVLEKARDILHALANDFGRLGRQGQMPR